MTERAADDSKSARKPRSSSREERRAAALRANLMRRKAQARARAQMQASDSVAPETDRAGES